MTQENLNIRNKIKSRTRENEKSVHTQENLKKRNYVVLYVAFRSRCRVNVLDANVMSVPSVNHHVPRVAVQTVRPVVKALSRITNTET